MRFILVIDNKQIEPGSIIKDFRGTEWKFVGITSYGRKVYVEPTDGSDFKREFFKSVFNAQIMDLAE